MNHGNEMRIEAKFQRSPCDMYKIICHFFFDRCRGGTFFCEFLTEEQKDQVAAWMSSENGRRNVILFKTLCKSLALVAYL